MISYFRYRNVLSTDGGPILELRHRNINYFEKAYEGYAYLESSFLTDDKYSGKIYGRADGSGYSTNLKEALCKGVSEAIERWAFYSTVNTGKCGFDIDSTTNGMAAFPSFSYKTVKAIALQEAYERWCLIEWWNGVIDGELIRNIEPDLHAIIFKHQKSCACIAFKNFNDLRVYGFAGSKTVGKALYKAKIELHRNYELLSEFDFSTKVDSIIDKRILYFAREGQVLFDRRLNGSKGRSVNPRLIIDVEIPGPWSKYAIVWRCLLQNSTSLFLNKDLDFFYF